jgi:hypothetical protein
MWLPFPFLFWTLNLNQNPLHLESIVLSGFRGFVKPEVPETPDSQFVIDQLEIEKADIDFYPKMEGAPIKIELDQLETRIPFNASTTLYTMIFDSRIIGRVDHSNISVIPHGTNMTQLKLDKFPMSIAEKYEKNLLFLIFKEGNVNLEVTTLKGPKEFQIDGWMAVENFELQSATLQTNRLMPQLVQKVKDNVKLNLKVVIEKDALLKDTPHALMENFQQALIVELNKRAAERVVAGVVELHTTATTSVYDWIAYIRGTK